jgi:hypothetical protein
MRESRHPQVGDMIVKSCTKTHQKWIGLVHAITRDTWGTGSVFVSWPNNVSPPQYNEKYGYSSTNIHNIRSEFDVIRKGKSIK